MIPKFRGLVKSWNEKENCFSELFWVYGYYSFDGSNHWIINPNRERASIVISETVSWCTGANDVNGKIIWGEDIIISLDGLRKYVVMYDAERARWFLRGIDKTWDEHEPVWCNYNKIGNIHQNKDLLEKRMPLKFSKPPDKQQKVRIKMYTKGKLDAISSQKTKFKDAYFVRVAGRHNSFVFKAYGHNGEDSKANAEELVRRWNNFHELLAKCKDLIKLLNQDSLLPMLDLKEVQIIRNAETVVQTIESEDKNND